MPGCPRRGTYVILLHDMADDVAVARLEAPVGDSLESKARNVESGCLKCVSYNELHVVEAIEAPDLRAFSLVLVVLLLETIVNTIRDRYKRAHAIICHLATLTAGATVFLHLTQEQH